LVLVDDGDVTGAVDFCDDDIGVFCDDDDDDALGCRDLGCRPAAFANQSNTTGAAVEGDDVGDAVDVACHCGFGRGLGNGLSDNDADALSC
jgi:hypothetical protein